jgi:SOS-response transcriptional repressor LexA
MVIIPINLKVRTCDNPDMSDRLKIAINQRIRQRLKQVGKSAAAVSIEAGFNDGYIRDMRRKNNALPGVDRIEALAKVLDVKPGWLAFGEGGDTTGGGILVRGEVAAGLWLEVGALDETTFDETPLRPDPRFPDDAQFALGVRGTSINRIAQPGDLLLCLDYAMTGIEPKQGSIVIVERRRAQAGVREVTAKRIERKGSLVYLHPDSDDPRWQEPIILDGKKVHEDEEVAIIAIVNGVYKPILMSEQRG